MHQPEDNLRFQLHQDRLNILQVDFYTVLKGMDATLCVGLRKENMYPEILKTKQKIGWKQFKVLHCNMVL